MRSLIRFSEAEVTKSLAHGRHISARPRDRRASFHHPDGGFDGRYRLQAQCPLPLARLIHEGGRDRSQAVEEDAFSEFLTEMVSVRRLSGRNPTSSNS